MATYSLKKDGNKALSEHFRVREFASTDGAMLYTDVVKVNANLIKKLEKFFKYGIDTVIVFSGYRNKSHDLAAGGDGYGAHTLGLAADISCYKNGVALEAKYVACLAEIIGFNGIGITGYTGCHVDVRTESNYKNGHWYGNEVTGEDNITSFFKYYNLTKAELFGEIGYYKQKQYVVRAKRKTPVRINPSEKAAIKKYYEKGKKARVWAEKNGFAKVLSGWIRISDLQKI